ncbi:uncharacterized protein BJ171DRAFT_498692 [Polychytrium aggregatum]|uniref:uncharacterized protein n=1 Tax=Polychytrium aggregatum TaxID=110093 RepID=UPI0022FDCC78|nr:uncharacterized protein BJ171DRAFT_498692 [Polychytrium aggregatum]KAI9206105.1 hypothetical protein BJ171DRAFT_498692 [Polychytrium aggregatum]
MNPPRSSRPGTASDLDPGLLDVLPSAPSSADSPDPASSLVWVEPTRFHSPRWLFFSCTDKVDPRSHRRRAKCTFCSTVLSGKPESLYFHISEKCLAIDPVSKQLYLQKNAAPATSTSPPSSPSSPDDLGSASGGYRTPSSRKAKRPKVSAPKPVLYSPHTTVSQPVSFVASHTSLYPSPALPSAGLAYAHPYLAHPAAQQPHALPFALQSAYALPQFQSTSFALPNLSSPSAHAFIPSFSQAPTPQPSAIHPHLLPPRAPTALPAPDHQALSHSYLLKALASNRLGLQLLDNPYFQDFQALHMKGSTLPLAAAISDSPLLSSDHLREKLRGCQSRAAVLLAQERFLTLSLDPWVDPSGVHYYAVALARNEPFCQIHIKTLELLPLEHSATRLIAEIESCLAALGINPLQISALVLPLPAASSFTEHSHERIVVSDLVLQFCSKYPTCLLVDSPLHVMGDALRSILSTEPFASVLRKNQVLLKFFASSRYWSAKLNDFFLNHPEHTPPSWLSITSRLESSSPACAYPSTSGQMGSQSNFAALVSPMPDTPISSDPAESLFKVNGTSAASNSATSGHPPFLRAVSNSSSRFLSKSPLLLSALQCRPAFQSLANQLSNDTDSSATGCPSPVACILKNESHFDTSSAAAHLVAPIIRSIESLQSEYVCSMHSESRLRFTLADIWGQLFKAVADVKEIRFESAGLSFDQREFEALRQQVLDRLEHRLSVFKSPLYSAAFFLSPRYRQAVLSKPQTYSLSKVTNEIAELARIKGFTADEINALKTQVGGYFNGLGTFSTLSSSLARTPSEATAHPTVIALGEVLSVPSGMSFKEVTNSAASPVDNPIQYWMNLVHAQDTFALRRLALMIFQIVPHCPGMDEIFLATSSAANLSPTAFCPSRRQRDLELVSRALPGLQSECNSAGLFSGQVPSAQASLISTDGQSLSAIHGISNPLYTANGGRASDHPTGSNLQTWADLTRQNVPLGEGGHGRRSDMLWTKIIFPDMTLQELDDFETGVDLWRRGCHGRIQNGGSQASESIAGADAGFQSSPDQHPKVANERAAKSHRTPISLPLPVHLSVNFEDTRGDTPICELADWSAV